jgi:hypothetical protein
MPGVSELLVKAAENFPLYAFTNSNRAQVSAATEDDEAQPQRQSNAHRISLLERLYRLRLVSAGTLWRSG